ncbi:MAG: TOTE conflict system archaeo-eukaryotic primase domain-containing protein [Bacillota bacterium]
MEALPSPAATEHTKPRASPLEARNVWWIPHQIAVFDCQVADWITLRYPEHTANVRSWQAVAISPLDVSGKAHFVAWDVDAGGWDAVKRLLKALPKGCCPLVSASGQKGYHVWLFPDSPIPAQRAAAFARAVAEAAGVKEFFPSSASTSRCLKWPGSLHPKTGRCEEFVAIERPTRTLDTKAVLEGLASGMFRTSANLISVHYLRSRAKLELVQKQHDHAPEAMFEQGWLEVFEDEQTAWKLLELFGKAATAQRLGQSFICPVHHEQHPSVTFVRDSNQRIAFHDFHASKHGLESEFFTLPELYAALKAGEELRKLDRRQQAACAKELAFLVGYRNETVNQTLSALLHSTQILLKTGWLTQPTFKRLVEAPHPKDWLELFSRKDLQDFERVWATCIWCFIQDAMDGKTQTVMSKRFVAANAAVKPEMANRSLNFLCTIGILEKLPVVRRGDRVGADRFRLCVIDEATVVARLQALGEFDLLRLNRKLAAEKLGLEIANAVFRRG